MFNLPSCYLLELLWLFCGNRFSDASGCVVSVSVTWPCPPLANMLHETDESLTVRLVLLIWWLPFVTFPWTFLSEMYGERLLSCLIIKCGYQFLNNYFGSSLFFFPNFFFWVMATGAACSFEVVLQLAPFQDFPHSCWKMALAWWGSRLQRQFFTQADVSCAAGQTVLLLQPPAPLWLCCNVKCMLHSLPNDLDGAFFADVSYLLRSHCWWYLETRVSDNFFFSFSFPQIPKPLHSMFPGMAVVEPQWERACLAVREDSLSQVCL